MFRQKCRKLSQEGNRTLSAVVYIRPSVSGARQPLSYRLMPWVAWGEKTESSRHICRGAVELTGTRMCCPERIERIGVGSLRQLNRA